MITHISSSTQSNSAVSLRTSRQTGLLIIPALPGQTLYLPRASFSSRPAHARKLNNSHFDSHMNPKMSLAFSVSAGLPEYVSTRQRRNSLRHGRSRLPRVAFQIKRSDPNTVISARISTHGIPSGTTFDVIGFPARRFPLRCQVHRFNNRPHPLPDKSLAQISDLPFNSPRLLSSIPLDRLLAALQFPQLTLFVSNICSQPQRHQ